MSSVASYDPSLSLRAALPLYFAENGFGEDGGYGDAWVDFKLGPIPMPFPNTPGRLRAVRYHDMHHLITGYRADQATGEFEIAAWEVGAGCRGFWAAWHLNLGGLAAGALGLPRRAFRAFVRGRRASSLYGRDYEALLDKTIAEVRAECGLDQPIEARASDLPLFILATLAGAVLAVPSLAALVVVSPPLVLAGLFRRSERGKPVERTQSERAPAPPTSSAPSSQPRSAAA
ncbi:hypothetical protein [Chondromyces apiculatus]|uniref:Ubiquinone biosynthesis protein n=1 Tax=Chondromyces apiculatus DSM 436 TaxID=1192034 RepID=A0A017T323_9BACT|nr:hypothetical protein [Chondromyces apiculatus]EYF03618.1 Hypothetical protein CAP_5409 [Chondromyces apiculatus DSM 436]